MTNHTARRLTYLSDLAIADEINGRDSGHGRRTPGPAPAIKLGYGGTGRQGSVLVCTVEFSLEQDITRLEGRSPPIISGANGKLIGLIGHTKGQDGRDSEEIEIRPDVSGSSGAARYHGDHPAVLRWLRVRCQGRPYPGHDVQRLRDGGRRDRRRRYDGRATRFHIGLPQKYGVPAMMLVTSDLTRPGPASATAKIRSSRYRDR